MDYDIATLDDFTNYFVDWVVYGNIYALVGFETSFPEIPLQDMDPYYVGCFEYNSYNYESDPTNNLPTKRTDSYTTSASSSYNCATTGASRRPTV